MSEKNKTYFISDIHLGADGSDKSMVRERLVVKWLEEIRKDASEIYLLGDVFDVWFEYKRVVPRGFTRFLGKIGEISDSGTPIHFFTGNHDHWMKDYLATETGVIMHYDKTIVEIRGKRFLLAHGDGLGPADKGYKMMKKIFTNPVTKWMYSRFHPNFGMAIAESFSDGSRKYKKENIRSFKGEDKEWLVLYAKQVLEKEHFDYFIFGHRHVPIKIELSEISTFFNLGDWLHYYSYAVFDGNIVELKFWTKE